MIIRLQLRGILESFGIGAAAGWFSSAEHAREKAVRGSQLRSCRDAGRPHPRPLSRLQERGVGNCSPHILRGIGGCVFVPRSAAGAGSNRRNRPSTTSSPPAGNEARPSK